MSYLLDANVFIEAKNRYYGFDFAPAFWDWLLASNEAGTIFSVEKVGDELLQYEDELSEWAKERVRAGGFFLKPDDLVLAGLKQVAAWAQGQNFTEAAINEFLQAGDLYLLAHAHAHGLIAVTLERLEPAAVKKIKIPNACQGLGVQWMDTYAMLRAEGARFVI